MLLALTILLIVLAGADVVRLSTRGAGGAAPLLAAFPRALLPVAVGVTAGVWQLEATFTTVATTGVVHGILTVLSPVSRLADVLFAGVMGCAVVLAVAVVASWPPPATAVASLPRRLSPVGAAALALGTAIAVGSASFVATAAERAVVGTVAPIAERVAPVPARYAPLARMSGETRARVLPASIRVGVTGGALLCGLVAILCLLTVARRRGPGGPATINALRAVATTMALVAGWYGLARLLVAVRWLAEVARLAS